MSAPAQIPGFYYDQVKKKYFRILPHHAAPASSSFYTATTVRKAEDAKQASSAAALESSKALAHRRRSLLASNPNVQTRLHRELGANNAVKAVEERRKLFASTLQREVVFEDEHQRRIAAFAVGEIAKGEPYDAAEGRTEDRMEVEGGSVGRRPRRWELVMGTTLGGVRSIPVSDCSYSSSDVDIGQTSPTSTTEIPSTWKASHRHISAVDYGSSAVTSVTLAPYPSSLLLTTYLGDASAPSASIFSLSSGITADSRLSLPNGTRSLWTSTCSSASSSEVEFALGTSNSIILLAPRLTPQPRIGASKLEASIIPTSTDIFAVEYQHTFPTSTGTPHTLLAGGRDGAVRLYDTRCHYSARGGPAEGQMVVKLGSTVCHIRMLDPDGVGVIVNGLGKTAVFDLRYPHVGSPMKGYMNETKEVMIIGGSTAKRRGVDGRRGVRRGQGRSRIDLGFDVDPIRGIVAAAEEEGEGGVGLWSLATGEKLRRFGGGADMKGLWRVLQFDKSEERTGLWGCRGGVVEWWGI